MVSMALDHVRDFCKLLIHEQIADRPTQLIHNLDISPAPRRPWRTASTHPAAPSSHPAGILAAALYTSPAAGALAPSRTSIHPQDFEAQPGRRHQPGATGNETGIPSSLRNAANSAP